MATTVHIGDCRDVLATLADSSVDCCVTSPPYFGLRDYGVAGQIGLEATPDAFVAEMVAVFREVRRVLKPEGTLWLNLGDSYANDTKWGGSTGGKHAAGIHGASGIGRGKKNTGLKAKDLIGIPWRVAFALQADGWWLRQDIIWSKPNPMPESVTDRCTKAHEYLFLLAKGPRYFYNADAIREPFADASIERLRQDIANQRGGDRVPGKTNGPMKAVGLNLNRSSYRPGTSSNTDGSEHLAKSDAGLPLNEKGRNKRSVWEVTTVGYAEAHFATFPPALIEPCILAGCPAGGIVLDPFGGAGTTGLVADRLGRNAVLIELNPSYAAMARTRIHNDAPLFSALSDQPGEPAA